MIIYLRNISVALLLMMCQSAFSAGGLFFNVSASGTPANVDITLCLNGKGPLSCQNYTVSALTLSLLTNIPNHMYPFAGIKINTPGYSPTGCTMDGNGYCLFSVSNTSATTITVNAPPPPPPTCQPGVIVFTPAVTQVNNPVDPGVISSNTPQQLTIQMALCNSQGQPLIPSASNPIHIDVYGAPDGVISPASTTSSTGEVTFTYNGQAFPNNISVNAWMSDSSNNGAALGVTQILKNNTLSCSASTTSYEVPLVSTLPNTLNVMADVGYAESAPSTSYTSFTIDTGSLGVLVPSRELPHNGNVIGPGAAGVKYYDSSGNTYSGNYYLAPVRVQLASGAVTTQPIMVLGIDKAYCTGPTTKACYSNPPSPNLHYLGVGFNRNSTTAGDLFNSPTANAFLHITNIHNGTDLTPGYYLTPGDGTTTTGLTLGITSTANYNVINLTPNPAVPGDFNPQAGCFSFPNSSPSTPFCGTALLDVGIDSMFIELPKNQWPAGTYDPSTNQVLAGVNMSILMGAQNAPSLSYNFYAVNGTPPPSNSPTPTVVQWVDGTATGQTFVNTGRRPLYIYDYFYNGQCGKVGFKPLP